MTAWVKSGTREEVWIITDYVDARSAVSFRVSPRSDTLNPFGFLDSLTEFNKQLVDAYLDIPYAETKCGYACSDQYASSCTVTSLEPC